MHGMMHKFNVALFMITFIIMWLISSFNLGVLRVGSFDRLANKILEKFDKVRVRRIVRSN